MKVAASNSHFVGLVYMTGTSQDQVDAEMKEVELQKLAHINWYSEVDAIKHSQAKAVANRIVTE
jgi:cytochrome b subunit of formate dehydrogenase